MAKKVGIWAFVLFVVFLAAYLAYGRYWGSERALSALGDVRGITLEKLSAAGEFLKEKTTKTFEKGIQSTYSYMKKGAGEGVASLGEGLTGLGNDLAENNSPTSTSSSANPSSVATTTVTVSSTSPESGFFSPAPLYSLVARKGEPLRFSMNREGDYTIDWGDGKTEGGSIASGGAAVVGHVWSRTGDYRVRIEVREKGAGAEQFSFPVRIYE